MTTKKNTTSTKKTTSAKKDYQGWVCSKCGIVANYITCLKKFGQPPLKACFSVSTYHKGTCSVCGMEESVTEARDFFYPDFSLLYKLIDKYQK